MRVRVACDSIVRCVSAEPGNRVSSVRIAGIEFNVPAVIHADKSPNYNAVEKNQPLRRTPGPADSAVIIQFAVIQKCLPKKRVLNWTRSIWMFCNAPLARSTSRWLSHVFFSTFCRNGKPESTEVPQDFRGNSCKISTRKCRSRRNQGWLEYLIVARIKLQIKIHSFDRKKLSRKIYCKVQWRCASSQSTHMYTHTHTRA